MKIRIAVTLVVLGLLIFRSNIPLKIFRLKPELAAAVHSQVAVKYFTTPPQGSPNILFEASTAQEFFPWHLSCITWMKEVVTGSIRGSFQISLFRVYYNKISLLLKDSAKFWNFCQTSSLMKQLCSTNSPIVNSDTIQIAQ